MAQGNEGSRFGQFLEELGGEPVQATPAERGGGRGAGAVEPPRTSGSTTSTPSTASSPETRCEQPGVADKWWQPLFLDLARRHVMYLEDDGIIGNQVVEDRSAPGNQRDLLWVRPNATVGVARMAQSIEGQFLSGQFTRAADFRDSPAGGTIAAATGVFCEGDSIGCCRPTRRG